jgi:hypothetical protein
LSPTDGSRILTGIEILWKCPVIQEKQTEKKEYNLDFHRFR